jgi:hypothetical protein
MLSRVIGLIRDDERAALEALAALADLNPFLLEERAALEQCALGGVEVPARDTRSVLLERACALAETLRERLAQRTRAPRRDLTLYEALVRGEYHPEPMRASGDLASQLERGELSAEDLLRHYCTAVYARTGSYEEAARRLGLDRRTVKAKVDLELLERLRG